LRLRCGNHRPEHRRAVRSRSEHRRCRRKGFPQLLRQGHRLRARKRKRQKPKPLALSSLTISQREWIPSPAFRWPTFTACAERRVLRLCLWLSFRLAPSAPPPACLRLSFQLAPSAHPLACLWPNLQLALAVPPLALPKARRPAFAFRLYPSVRPVSRRLPTRVGCLGSRLPAAGSPDSHRALRPQALCLRPTSGLNRLLIL
jgi:hypothetical protein